MTKNDIIDRVVELVQDKSSSMRTLLGKWVDIVLQDMSGRGLLPSLRREETTITLVNGTRDYTIGSDIDHVSMVFVPAWGQEEGRLIKKSWEEIAEFIMQDGTAFTGRPKYYAIRKQENKIRLHPPPDSDNAPASPAANEKLALYTYRDVTTLALTDSVTEIKLKHIPLIILGAYSFGARLDSLVDSQDAFVRYERGLKRFTSDLTFDLERPVQNPYNSL